MSKENVLTLCSRRFANEGKNVISAVRKHLADEDIHVHVWTETLFSPNSIDSSVKIFLRDIYKYDAAIVVLTAESIVSNTAGRPTENIIFELGACMAHFGHEKTFVLSARDDNITPPSYFKNFKRLEWDPAPTMSNWAAATEQACQVIVSKVKRGHLKMCDIGLPAVSAVSGYASNFLEHVLKHALEDCDNNECGFHANLKTASTCEVYVVLSEETSTYDNTSAKRFLTNKGLSPTKVVIGGGRFLSVYYKIDNGIMKVYDVPTTLSGCNAALEKFVKYMGVGDDDEFQEDLMRKELFKFGKWLTMRIKKEPNKHLLRIVKEDLVTIVEF